VHRSGIGAIKNSAKVIEIEHERIYWEKGVLGMLMPKILVYFYAKQKQLKKVQLSKVESKVLLSYRKSKGSSCG